MLESFGARSQQHDPAINLLDMEGKLISVENGLSEGQWQWKRRLSARPRFRLRRWGKFTQLNAYTLYGRLQRARPNTDDHNEEFSLVESTLLRSLKHRACGSVMSREGTHGKRLDSPQCLADPSSHPLQLSWQETRGVFAKLQKSTQMLKACITGNSYCHHKLPNDRLSPASVKWFLPSSDPSSKQACAITIEVISVNISPHTRM